MVPSRFRTLVETMYRQAREEGQGGACRSGSRSTLAAARRAEARDEVMTLARIGEDYLRDGRVGLPGLTLDHEAGFSERDAQPMRGRPVGVDRGDPVLCAGPGNLGEQPAPRGLGGE